MVELFKAIYPKVTIKDFNGYLLSTYYMQACKWIFVFTQGKQNITDGKGYLKFGVISSGKTFNYLTGFGKSLVHKALSFLFSGEKFDTYPSLET